MPNHTAAPKASHTWIERQSQWLLTLFVPWHVFITGAVPVRPVDGHAVLSAAPRPNAPQCGQGEGEATFPEDHRSGRSPGSKEWSHALLDSGETAVPEFCHQKKKCDKVICRLALCLIFILPPAGRGWTWWGKCMTVLQSSPAVLWRTVTMPWRGAIPSTTASHGSVWSAGQSPALHLKYISIESKHTMQ